MFNIIIRKLVVIDIVKTLKVMLEILSPFKSESIQGTYFNNWNSPKRYQVITTSLKHFFTTKV